jgi:type IV pilus assembly protein PilB
LRAATPASAAGREGTAMNPEQAGAEPQDVLRTRAGVTTLLTPRSSLLSSADIDLLIAACTDCLRLGDTQLVVDLGSVRTLNSVALEALIDLQEQAVRHGGWLKLTNANTLVADILRITAFERYVPVLQREAPEAPASTQPRKRLGDILVERGLLTEERITEAIALQNRSNRRLGQIIIEKGWVSEQVMLETLGAQLGIPFVRLRAGIYDPDVVTLISPRMAKRLQVLPLQKFRGVLYLATSDPQAIPVFDEIEQLSGCHVKPVIARCEEILNAYADAYSGKMDSLELAGDVDADFAVIENPVRDDYAAIDEMAEGSPIINLVNSLIQRAIRDSVSDIHIEPSRNLTRIRYRIDGVLYEVSTLSAEYHPAIVSRLKVMANLDIAERRMPQDGRIQVHTRGRAVDLRFSSLPGLFGEKIVLRVLDKNHALLDINRLGMSSGNLTLFKTLLDSSNGLILVTGPTGSGKTTSLYAALNYLNSMEKNIVTIEDPVEYQLDIINQNEVHDVVGLGFSTILRHALRQDPDIIMVGEIRDRETAEIAIQAALTGHLVLSTLHTNHAIGAITRMIEMEVEPYLLSSAMIGVVAQRLVRTICPNCKTQFLAEPELAARFGWSGQVQLARGRGCSECYDSGYRGRMGIHEVLRVDEALRHLLTTNPDRDALTTYLAEHDFRNLYTDGLEHVRRCKTTLEEVARVINI